MLICSVCGAPYPHEYHCTQSHPGMCHGCGALSFSHTYGYYDHADPEAPRPPAPLVLSPQDVQALVRYQQHVQRTVGTGPLLRMLTQEDTRCP